MNDPRERKRDLFAIADRRRIGLVDFRQYPEDAVFLRMKIVEAGLKLDDDEDYHTNGDARRESGDIDQAIAPVTDQVPDGDLEIVSEHWKEIIALLGQGSGW